MILWLCWITPTLRVSFSRTMSLLISFVLGGTCTTVSVLMTRDWSTSWLGLPTPVQSERFRGGQPEQSWTGASTAPSATGAPAGAVVASGMPARSISRLILAGSSLSYGLGDAQFTQSSLRGAANAGGADTASPMVKTTLATTYFSIVFRSRPCAQGKRPAKLTGAGRPVRIRGLTG